MPYKIFVSYRRDDSRGEARSIHQRLCTSFGAANVFMDVDAIERGTDFRAAIARNIAESTVVLVVIGPGWLRASGDKGLRRIDDPHDLVRSEVVEALRRNLVVMPVLINDAEMPTAAELPEPLQPLAYRHAARITHENFHTDMVGLETSIQLVLPKVSAFPLLPVAAAAGLLVALALVVLGLAGHLPGLLPVGPGKVFRDCSLCPELVIVPIGDVRIGGTHPVVIDRPFAISKFEITFDEWTACAADGGCTSNRTPGDSGWGKGRRPVINVSWSDASEYVQWLSRKTGKRYRLPSESEWEYAARAGSTGEYATGSNLSSTQANFNSGPGDVFRQRTLPVGSFAPNAYGLYDVHGNVSEWVEDCWNDNLDGIPSNGEARGGDCRYHVIRGGSWGHGVREMSFLARFRTETATRGSFDGFRVARSL